MDSHPFWTRCRTEVASVVRKYADVFHQALDATLQVGAGQGQGAHPRGGGAEVRGGAGDAAGRAPRGARGTLADDPGISWV